MTIQAIGAVNTNTNINNNINNNFKNAASRIEKPKENINNADDEKKVFAALSGLAVLSIAGIGVAAALRKGKVAAAPKDSAGTIKDAQNIVKNLPQLGKQSVMVSEIHASGQKGIINTAEHVGRQTNQGTKHIHTERKPASNINRSGNPAGRSKPAAVRNKQAEAEARALMLKKNDAMRQTLADASKSIISSVGDINNAGQGIKSATDIQVLDKKAEIAQNAAQNIMDKAQEMRNMAKEIPTHKNIKRAQVAENKAIRAKLDADKVREKVDGKKAQIAADAARKEQNIQQMIQNTTPERLIEGQRKMEENARKTSAKAVQRRANRTVNKPGYQRALKQFQNYSPEKLQAVINSTKSSNIEKIVAQDLLAAAKV